MTLTGFLGERRNPECGGSAVEMCVGWIWIGWMYLVSRILRGMAGGVYNLYRVTVSEP